MGRGSSDSSHEAFYWQLRSADMPLPEDDERERYLLRQAKMLDERDRRSAAGEFSIGLSWGMRLGSPQTASARARQLEEILKEDPDCIDAVACADSGSRTIMAFAVISHPNGWWAARRRSEELTERARKRWRPGRGVSLHVPTPYAPSEP